MLIYAAYSGSMKVVEYLISHRTSINERDKYQDTAMSSSTEEGIHGIVDFLLEKGADAELLVNENHGTIISSRGGKI